MTCPFARAASVYCLSSAQLTAGAAPPISYRSSLSLPVRHPQPKEGGAAWLPAGFVAPPVDRPPSCPARECSSNCWICRMSHVPLWNSSVATRSRGACRLTAPNRSPVPRCGGAAPLEMPETRDWGRMEHLHFEWWSSRCRLEPTSRTCRICTAHDVAQPGARARTRDNGSAVSRCHYRSVCAADQLGRQSRRTPSVEQQLLHSPLLGTFVAEQQGSTIWLSSADKALFRPSYPVTGPVQPQARWEGSDNSAYRPTLSPFWVSNKALLTQTEVITQIQFARRSSPSRTTKSVPQLATNERLWHHADPAPRRAVLPLPRGREGLSPLTVQAYRADMKSFLGFLEREHIAPNWRT